MHAQARMRVYARFSLVEEEEGTMVAVDAVMVDADADDARTILALPIQQRKVYVAISAPMCLTMATSLHQI
jgi:hypothetical protein